MSEEENERDDQTWDAAPAAGTPRWVKIFVLVALVFAVLVVVLLISDRGGGHGPGRHSSFDDAGAPAATVVEGHTPPVGADAQP